MINSLILQTSTAEFFVCVLNEATRRHQNVTTAKSNVDYMDRIVQANILCYLTEIFQFYHGDANFRVQ